MDFGCTYTGDSSRCTYTEETRGGKSMWSGIPHRYKRSLCPLATRFTEEKDVENRPSAQRVITAASMIIPCRPLHDGSSEVRMSSSILPSSFIRDLGISVCFFFTKQQRRSFIFTITGARLDTPPAAASAVEIDGRLSRPSAVPSRRPFSPPAGVERSKEQEEGRSSREKREWIADGKTWSNETRDNNFTNNN